MPKRKKHPRLPNAFGSIRYLGKGRRNPYAVHPPCKDVSEAGDYVRPRALCYVDDWYVGFAVLNAYHAGTYKPGDEETIRTYRAASATDLDAFCKRLLKDYSLHAHTEMIAAENEKTFADVYHDFFEWKYGEHAARKLSRQSRDCTKAAFKNAAALHDRPFRSITLDEMQNCVNSCPLKASSIELVVSLFHQIYNFAFPRQLCDQNYGAFVKMPDAEPDEKGVPFTEDDLKILWEHKDDPTVEMILIMCYSGFRIAAYPALEVNLSQGSLRGGIKTKAGKGRVVPIHSAIRPLIANRMARDGSLLCISTAAFRSGMYRKLRDLGIEKHTPHDCRHTFSMLCEKYGVNENDRKRMLGHSFGNDITNAVYGHRTLDDLKKEIEKIVVICDY